ncbi:MAG: hypothetical protein HQ567_06360 [Candidatus Nealsonbacteria bacterium]|nr:hypothetical protein [Candidatus Nealsonbacteria bacterium]
MKVVKFCSRSHNPVISRTKVQVCSVYYYRSTDNDFIRDIEEGEISRAYHPPSPAAYSGNEIGRMMGQSISGSGTIRFQGKAVRTTHDIPNAYVFCTSRFDRPTLEQAASLGYDSFYVIRDPELFCDRMAQAIRTEVAISSDVIAFHGEVSYQEDKEVVFSHLPDFFRSHKTIDPHLYLLKRRASRENGLTVYANEYEYRFVFVPVDEHKKPIPLTTDKIYLESSVMKDIVE